MKKSVLSLIISVICVLPMFAETNALIEAKLFKDWIIKGESSFCNLAIKNTGTSPILLAEKPADFSEGQLVTRPLPRRLAEDKEQEEQYQLMLLEKGEFLKLLPEETHVYEGRKFLLNHQFSFAEEIRFTISVYLGKGVWLDSEPLMINGVVSDSEEYLATVLDNPTDSKLASEKRSGFSIWDLVAVTYKNERWLYKKSTDSPHSYPVCPLSLMNKIRIEDHEGENLFKIWDGDKPMIYHIKKSILLEGPDENDVLGKWTRERKQKAEADNAEGRRKKQEAGN